MFDKRSEKSTSRFVSAATLFGKNEIRGTQTGKVVRVCTGTKVETSRGTGRRVHEETARQRRKERKEGARAFFERGSSRLHFRLLTRFSRFQDRPVLSGPFISRLIIICILRQLARNRLAPTEHNLVRFFESLVSVVAVTAPETSDNQSSTTRTGSSLSRFLLFDDSPLYPDRSC